MSDTGAMMPGDGYWIVSGPRSTGGKPKWPARWHAQFLPDGGGIYDCWAATEEDARREALAKAEAARSAK